MTFEKNGLELRLLELTEERAQLIRVKEQDSGKVLRAANEAKELRDAVESLKGENDRLRLQARKQQLTTSAQSQDRTQLQAAQKSEEALRK